MTLETASVIFCLVLGGFFLGLWMFYDRRDHARFEGERRQMAFHCMKCGHLYAEQGGPEEAACPKCGHANGRLRF